MNPFMTRRFRVLLLLLCLCQVRGGLADSLPVVRLATLEWPPYNSETLPQGGVNTALVRAAFAAAGYRLEVETFPWSAAVYKGLHDARFDGYFPEYLSPAARRDCYLSERAGESPVVLAKRKDSQYPPVRGVSDLARYRIGVVQGYNNTEAFDANVARGVQKVDVALSDEQNLDKLAHGRVALIIIDRNVMTWLLANSPRLRGQEALLDSLRPPLQVQGLYICFKRDAQGQTLADSFSGGLRHVDVDDFTRRYLSALHK